MKTGRSDKLEEIAETQNMDPDLLLAAEKFWKIISAVIGGYDGKLGPFYHLAIEESYRQQGIGSDLLENLE